MSDTEKDRSAVAAAWRQAEEQLQLQSRKKSGGQEKAAEAVLGSLPAELLEEGKKAARSSALRCLCRLTLHFRKRPNLAFLVRRDGAVKAAAPEQLPMLCRIYSAKKLLDWGEDPVPAPPDEASERRARALSEDQKNCLLHGSSVILNAQQVEADKTLRALSRRISEEAEKEGGKIRLHFVYGGLDRLPELRQRFPKEELWANGISLGAERFYIRADGGPAADVGLHMLYYALLRRRPGIVPATVERLRRNGVTMEEMNRTLSDYARRGRGDKEAAGPELYDILLLEFLADCYAAGSLQEDGNESGSESGHDKGGCCCVKS